MALDTSELSADLQPPVEEKIIITEEEAVEKFAALEADVTTLNMRVDNVHYSVQTQSDRIDELEASQGDRIADLEHASKTEVTKNEFNMLAQAIQLVASKCSDLANAQRKLALRQEEVVHIVHAQKPSLIERIFGKAPGDGPQPNIPYVVNYMKEVEDNLHESWTHFPCFWSLKENQFFYFTDKGKPLYLVMKGYTGLSVEFHAMTESDGIGAYSNVVNATHHKEEQENP
jgi:hypothetical protein